MILFGLTSCFIELVEYIQTFVVEKEKENTYTNKKINQAWVYPSAFAHGYCDNVQSQWHETVRVKDKWNEMKQGRYRFWYRVRATSVQNHQHLTAK